MLDFRLPTEQDRADAVSFYDEIANAGSTCIGIGNYKNYEQWLAGMQHRYAGEDLPAGYVRENFYLCKVALRLWTGAHRNRTNADLLHRNRIKPGGVAA